MSLLLDDLVASLKSGQTDVLLGRSSKELAKGLKFSIRAVDNGYLVESNYRWYIRIRGPEINERRSKEDMSEEIFADTLPKAVDVLRQLTSDYVNRIEEARTEDRLYQEANERTRAVFFTIKSLTPKGADQEGTSVEAVKSHLSHRYSSDEVQREIDFFLKNGVIFSPSPGYVTYAKKK
jgi:hypothetical protein